MFLSVTRAARVMLDVGEEVACWMEDTPMLFPFSTKKAAAGTT